MIDAPGPWGTGPFTLVEGYSSIDTIHGDPAGPPRVRRDQHDHGRGSHAEGRARGQSGSQLGPRTARLEQVVFVNDLSPAGGAGCGLRPRGRDRHRHRDLAGRCPAGAGLGVRAAGDHRRQPDAHRRLQYLRGPTTRRCSDVRMREALNWAVDRHGIATEAFAGYAVPLAALTPTWCNGAVADLEPRRRDPARAKELADAAGWPDGRALRIAADAVAGGHRADDCRRRRRMRSASRAEIIVVPADERSPGHGRSSRRSCCRPGTSCSTRGLTCRPTTRQRSCIESSSATTAPSGRPTGPGVRPDLRRARAHDRCRPVAGAGRADRPVRLRAVQGAVPLRAQRALRGQPARRLQGVPRDVRAGRHRGIAPNTGHARTTNLNRLRVMPTGAAHRASILRPP